MNPIINDLSSEEVDRDLECTICHDLLVCPVTLMCQHTFCRLCIQSYVKQQVESDDDIYISKKENAKCPMCRCVVIVPPNDNYTLKAIIQAKYPELYLERFETFHKKGLLKLGIREEIKEEIRGEIFNGIVEDAVNENINILDNVQFPREIRYINTNRHWISHVFPDRKNLIFAWVSLTLFLIMLLMKYKVSAKTYLGTTMISWGLMLYFYTRY